MPGIKTDTQAGVNSVEVAGRLIEALSGMEGPARLTDLAQATGMPSAKAHRYLVSLVRAGLVEQDAETSRYDLGAVALRAGIVALGRSDLLTRAERRLQTIMEQTGETAAVAIWGTHGPTLVRVTEARHRFARTVPPGHVCALTSSAVGLVYCAFGGSARLDALLAREIEQNKAVGRPNAPTTRSALRSLVEAVRSRGCATVAYQGDGGLAAVSVPVLDRDGAHLQAALTVFGQVGRLNVEADGPIAALMLDIASELRAELCQ